MHTVKISLYFSSGAMRGTRWHEPVPKGDSVDIGSGSITRRCIGLLQAVLLCLCLFGMLAGGASPARAESKRVIRPTIGEPVVRQWFDAIHLQGYRRVALFHEFQPIDGSLVARYAGKGAHSDDMLFITYMDEERKHPTYGMFRTALEMVSVGARGMIERRVFDSHVWYGDDSDRPTVATDLGPKVRVVLMSYKGVELQGLFDIAKSLDLSILEKALK